MGPLEMLTSNYILNVGVLSWFIAQVLKTLLVFIPTRKIVWERMVGSGGMPSSHSALVCGVTMALAGIVMYDAMGVRRAAGEQAKVLNKMVIDFKMMFQMLKEEMDALARGESAPVDLENRSGKELKEFLGHTPLEVLCGAALGLLIAVLMPAF